MSNFLQKELGFFCYRSYNREKEGGFSNAERQFAFELSEKFLEKPSLEAGLEEEIAYTKELLPALEGGMAACGEKITLIARTNTAVAVAANGKLDEGFCFNKDAGILQYPAGELARCAEKRAAQNGNTYLKLNQHYIN